MSLGERMTFSNFVENKTLLKNDGPLILGSTKRNRIYRH
jgi:hypothetical protein